MNPAHCLLPDVRSIFIDTTTDGGREGAVRVGRNLSFSQLLATRPKIVCKNHFQYQGKAKRRLCGIYMGNLALNGVAVAK